jgi:hypothetical protein
MNELNQFKLIIAGSRGFDDRPLMEEKLYKLISGDRLFNKYVSIVSGMARGADSIAADIARVSGLPLHEFPVTSQDWERLGKSAGYKRNAAMADFADGLLAFWDGESRGTKHMIDLMEKQHKPVHIVLYNNGETS